MRLDKVARHMPRWAGVEPRYGLGVGACSSVKVVLM